MLSNIIENIFNNTINKSNKGLRVTIKSNIDVMEYSINQIIDFKFVSTIDSFDKVDLTIPYFENYLSKNNIKHDPFLDLFTPLSFKECKVYYDDELILNGILLSSIPSISESSKIIQITVAASASIINDVNIAAIEANSKFEFENMSLVEIANEICSPYGIKTVIENIYDFKPFSKVAIEPEQTIFDFLVDLIKDEGTLITNNSNGDLLFHKIISKLPSCIIEQDKYPFIDASPSFNPQSFFTNIVALSEIDSDKNIKDTMGNYPMGNDILPAPLRNNKSIFNILLKRTHIFVCKVKKGITYDPYTSAKVKYGRMLANSISYTLVVEGHKNNTTKELYKKGDFITVYAPNAAIMQHTTFLIKELELNRTVRGGDITTMTLVLPESYTTDINTNELFNKLPWLKYDVNK